VALGPRLLSDLAVQGDGLPRPRPTCDARQTNPYAVFTPCLRIPNGVFTEIGSSLRPSDTRGSAMTDIIYIGLGLGSFVMFALIVRRTERF